MKVYNGIEDFDPPQFAVVTTGTFDGVHQGHMQILNQLKELASENDGESVVVSFHPHPRTVIHPDADIKMLHTIDEKIKRLELAGIDHFVIIPFTKDFSRTSSMSFVRDILIKKLNTKILVLGYDHQFGRNREGSIEDLQEYSLTYDFRTVQIPVHTFDDINISSTKIRKALFDGDVKLASVYLGYNFIITGKVIHGKKLGKKIGFPTANIDVQNEHKIIPANGVYAVEVAVGNERFGGMLNIGEKPTISNSGEISVEVHIFNFDRNIYDQNVEIRFIDRIRKEQKFDGLEQLESQLKQDQAIALKLI